MATTPHRTQDKELNRAESYSKAGSVVTRNTLIFDSNGNPISSFGGGSPLATYATNDIDDGDTTTDITYIGKETDSGTWAILKIDETTSTLPTFQYATVKNNAGTTTYSTAWTNRASLTYQDVSLAF